MEFISETNIEGNYNSLFKRLCITGKKNDLLRGGIVIIIANIIQENCKIQVFSEKMS